MAWNVIAVHPVLELLFDLLVAEIRHEGTSPAKGRFPSCLGHF
jgi:hypothetical protein